MSEMIERVAKAIAQNQHQGWLYDQAAVATLHPEGVAQKREWLRKAAVAVIEAMREPTNEMRKVCTFETAEIEYPAMIDAALKP